MGWIFYIHGNFDNAIAHYDKAIEQDQSFVLAWNNKGTALQALGRDVEAKEAFARASALGMDMNATNEIGSNVSDTEPGTLQPSNE